MASTSQRNGKGRQKVKMEKMKNKSHLQVTFSKRRSGLFKKASQLCTLTGSEVGIIVNSPGGKVFSFGHPSVDKIVNKCFPALPLHSHLAPGVGPHNKRMVEPHMSVAGLNLMLSTLELGVEAERGRGAALVERERVELGSHNPIEKMGIGELKGLRASLHALKAKVERRVWVWPVPMVDPGLNVNPVGEIGNLGLINPMGMAESDHLLN